MRSAPVAAADRDASRSWWSFRPVRAVTPPPVRDAAWPRSEIDRFILAGLEARGLSPAAAGRPAHAHPPRDVRPDRPAADARGGRRVPGRRSPDAFAKVVDRLLASPAYGERWARHWLDVVRYTDYFYPEPHAHGRAALFELFEAWRYRDWVVGAFNRDMPYDRFIVHQVAGDLLPAPDGGPVYPDGVIATGLLALSVFDNGDSDKIKIVGDIVDDEIDVIGKAFLGLTLACARCHDHKFDPIPTRDYYGLAGIFHSTRILAERRRRRRPHGGAARSLGAEVLPGEARAAIEAARGARGDRQGAGEAPRPRRRSWRDRLAWAESIAGRAPRGPPSALLPEPPLALAAQDGGTPGGLFAGIQDVPLHVRGSYTRLGPIVPRHLPGLFGETSCADQPGERPAGAGALDRAGRQPDDRPRDRQPGLAASFRRGDRPHAQQLRQARRSRPATPSCSTGWPIGSSATDGRSSGCTAASCSRPLYQQSSVAGPESLQRDPDNRWLGRMTPRRLEAEAIRDGMLFVAGRLDRTPGGPATGDLDRPAAVALHPDGPPGPRQLLHPVRRRQPRAVGRGPGRLDRRPPGPVPGE